MNTLEGVAMGIAIYGLTVVRYFLFAGIPYWFFWVWKKDRFRPRRIQQRTPNLARLRKEISCSLLTCLIITGSIVLTFCMMQAGLTRIYFNISDYGAGYFFLSILLMIVLHDAYFYWTHRLLHQKIIFKYIHRIHHFSSDPSPWAAYSFHPVEATIQAAILPIFAGMMPVHYAALFIFITCNLANNILGHLGYEIFPKSFIGCSAFKWLSTSTHHNLHHEKFDGNYSLYFRWWDRAMRTTHPDYIKRFQNVTQDSGK